MKRIFLIGFQGINRNKLFKNEPILIRYGHVGIQFEDDEVIYAFRPDEKAESEAGTQDQFIARLKLHEQFEGAVFDDTEIFLRAYEISQQDTDITVWEISFEISDEDFAEKRQQVLQWYSSQETFIYAFPIKDSDEHVKQGIDNCATFPRRILTIEKLPENTGNLAKYIPQMKLLGKKWQPKGKSE
jgi:hypothetical protein